MVTLEKRDRARNRRMYRSKVSIRKVLRIIVVLYCKALQLDVNKAYLKADIEGGLYTICWKCPRDLVDAYFLSPKSFKEELAVTGFHRSHTDSMVFRRVTRKKVVIIVVYVDDMVMLSATKYE